MLLHLTQQRNAEPPGTASTDPFQVGKVTGWSWQGRHARFNFFIHFALQHGLLHPSIPLQVWCRGANTGQGTYSPVEALLQSTMTSRQLELPGALRVSSSHCSHSSSKVMWKMELSSVFLSFCFSPEPPPHTHPHAAHHPRHSPPATMQPRAPWQKANRVSCQGWSSERDNWHGRLKQQCAQAHWAAASAELGDVHAYVSKSAFARCQGSFRRICLDPSKGTPVPSTAFPE